MADKYDVIWDPREGRYVARHERCRDGDELRWSERNGADRRSFDYWRELRALPESIAPHPTNRPRVTMGTFDGYAKATAAIVDYPSRGAYV